MIQAATRPKSESYGSSSFMPEAGSILARYLVMPPESVFHIDKILFYNVKI